MRLLAMMMLAALAFSPAACGSKKKKAPAAGDDGTAVGTVIGAGGGAGGDADDDDDAVATTTTSATGSSDPTDAGPTSTTQPASTPTGGSASDASASGSTSGSASDPVDPQACDAAGYVIGGTASRLVGDVVLQLNGANDLTVHASGALHFACKLLTNATYAVTVKTQPTGQTCTLAGDTGTVAGADVTGLTVTCAYVPAHLTCDGGIVAINDADATDAAKAMGVCDGLQTASYTMPDGRLDSALDQNSNNPIADVTQIADFALGHGLLTGFGTNVHPQEGTRLLALSSGTARAVADAGYVDPADVTDQGDNKGYISVIPAGMTGLPSLGDDNSPPCQAISTEAHDGIALNLTLTVPPGANRFTMKYKYYGADYPNFQCQLSVDQPGIIVTTPARDRQNIFLSTAGHPLNQNTTGLDVCAASTGYGCTAGTSELAGTGFPSATTWRQAEEVVVVPGQTVTIKIMIWDSNDGYFDSTMLVDSFEWLAR